MPDPIVTVVVPTLAAGAPLLDCVYALDRQTQPRVEIVVVDNSGRGLARQSAAARLASRIIEFEGNRGFGAAVNAGFLSSRAPYLATINDDAVAHPQWLERLVAAMESEPGVGMCASQIRLAGQDLLDSAGMLVSGDGSSKQRGQFQPPGRYARREEVLFPSACAALYRRQMLEEVGFFDEDFFLYCEDTDLGLRARWAGWKCLYVPEAVVEHGYSKTAGRASPLKAFYVERNRLFVLLKNYPARMLWKAPFFSVARYGWHLLAMLANEGLAAQFRASGHHPLEMAFLVARAHFALLFHLPALVRKRRQVLARARISEDEFCALVRTHWISPRQVASL
ncbi:MAG: glycosyltransferase family 2 protein [Bryobacterales bacterium]|nr:glycosyltransferase family 2 protein [Bryobacteraceae bacterium]MDW8130049.1 glycosyltransferase family 2 protein [Bryobacterales bacterium]